MHDERIDRFLARITEADGSQALSDAKAVQLVDPARRVLIEEEGDVVALGVTAPHDQPDGTVHWAVETALEPGLRFSVFEDRLLKSAIDLVPRPGIMSVWSHRHSFDAALTRAGFESVRELAQMAVELPVHLGDVDIATRPFRSVDATEIVAINRSAFESHREAASLTEADIGQLIGKKGLEASGFLITERNREIVGFCWTRLHDNGDGEIYRVAVSPRWQGKGLGRSLVLAGFDHLARLAEVERGTLWVDMANEAAMNLYKSLGMAITGVNREFEK